MPMWNPWHGCHKISEGCRHCYVYREDAAFGTAVPSNEVRLTTSFHLPIKRDRKKNWKFPPGTQFALCFTSDLLIEEGDQWRGAIWDIIRQRNDCSFFFFTKRIERLAKCLPYDWDDGYDNVPSVYSLFHVVGAALQQKSRSAGQSAAGSELTPFRRRSLVATAGAGIERRARTGSGRRGRSGGGSHRSNRSRTHWGTHVYGSQRGLWRRPYRGSAAPQRAVIVRPRGDYRKGCPHREIARPETSTIIYSHVGRQTPRQQRQAAYHDGFGQNFSFHHKTTIFI